jgi:predicted transcriptional regulator of viral defense system
LYHASTLATLTHDQVLDVFRHLGIVRAADLEARGIPRALLYRMKGAGLIRRQARGIYVISEHSYSAQHTLAQVARRVPAGVFCLLTALRFHGLTTQAPA